MINAWDYAYDNYDGDNEDSIRDSITEQLVDAVLDAIDINETIDSRVQEQYAELTEVIRDIVAYNVNFNEIKKQAEDDRDEYFERKTSRRG